MTKDIFKGDVLKGKVAIVTGAGRGIGRAAAIALAQAGADIVGIDICDTVSPINDFLPTTTKDLEYTGHCVEKYGSQWMPFIADQRKIELLYSIRNDIVQRWGKIDIIFANAGIQAFKPLLDMQDQDWYDQIDCNLNGTANVIRAFTPSMVDKNSGKIIITSSTQGLHGTLNGAAYSASKWGLIGLMKSAALEFAKYNINVNAVIPGLIDTALTRHNDRYIQIMEAAGLMPTESEEQNETKAIEIMSKKIPFHVPWIAPEEIAPMIVFLASDAASMITGSSFSITAGDSANITF